MDNPQTTTKTYWAVKRGDGIVAFCKTKNEAYATMNNCPSPAHLPITVRKVMVQEITEIPVHPQTHCIYCGAETPTTLREQCQATWDKLHKSERKRNPFYSGD